MVMQKLNFLLVVICFASGCSLNRAQSSISQDEFSLQANIIAKSINNTPYSALVSIISKDIIELPDEDKFDDFSEQKIIYHVDVLETYRGKERKKISYVMLVENGEKTDFQKTLFIITLCDSKEGFYWPGVGASFSDDSKLKSLARAAAKQVDNKQVAFSDCE